MFAQAYMGRKRWAQPYDRFCHSTRNLFRISLQSLGEDQQEHRRSLHYATPDFLLILVALSNFMRLSLLKAAHAVLSSAAWQEIRVRSGRDDNSAFPRKIRNLSCNRFVISTGGVMGLRPTQGDEKRLGSATTLYRTVTLSLSSRPKRSGAEGPAVPRTLPGDVFRQSEAEWRDLRFPLVSDAKTLMLQQYGSCEGST